MKNKRSIIAAWLSMFFHLEAFFSDIFKLFFSGKLVVFDLQNVLRWHFFSSVYLQSIFLVFISMINCPQFGKLRALLKNMIQLWFPSARTHANTCTILERCELRLVRFCKDLAQNVEQLHELGKTKRGFFKSVKRCRRNLSVSGRNTGSLQRDIMGYEALLFVYS